MKQLVAITTACLLLSAHAFAEAPLRPNIIFILADDLGKEWISSYGAEDIRTPHIDALAKGGMKFDNFYSMPQCTPTRVALLTGKYPHHNGWVNHWDAPRWGDGYFDWKHPENTTVFSLLQKHGYKTAAAGKWQINDFRKEPDAMAHHGFDDWFMWTGFEAGKPASAKRYADPYIHSREGSRTYGGKFGPDLYVDFLIDFMRKHKSEPFALYYPACLPHTPLVATPDEPDAKSPLEKHKAMVRYLDKLVGRIVAAVKEEGLESRTLIIFTTDNGSTGSITGTLDGRRVKGAKAALSEAGTCQPFIAYAPGLVPAGVVTDTLTDITDMLPTFLDLAGATVPTDLATDGVSLAPVLTGRSDDAGREWIMALGFGAAIRDEQGIRPKLDFTDRVIRDKTHKVWVSSDQKITRLHHLGADPWEETNLLTSEDPEATAALEKFQAVVNALPAQDARPIYTPREASAE